jgi:Protein of unknown function (DUF664)
MSFEAAIPTPTNDERELLLRFLRRQRAEVVATADGLTDQQARWTPDQRLLPIIGIINHLTLVEWRWINGRYLGQPFPARGEEFELDPGRSLADVLDAYRARGTQTDEIITAAPALSVPCLGQEGNAPPAHVLLGLAEPLDLRWAVLHLIEETAHHAGHADSTRELIDGKQMRA